MGKGPPVKGGSLGEAGEEHRMMPVCTEHPSWPRHDTAGAQEAVIYPEGSPCSLPPSSPFPVAQQSLL